MNRPKYITPVLIGIAVAGIGYGIISFKQPLQTTIIQSATVDEENNNTNVSLAEQYKIYEPFGMSYDANKNELTYNGKLVRWFEDYYPVGVEGEQAGIDFLNENGNVDVYAIRDLKDIERTSDGSYDPSGKLVGLQEFSEEAFKSRDIENLKMPPMTAVTIDTTTEIDKNAKTFKELFEAYKNVGIRYEESKTASGVGNVYYNDELVNRFADISPSGTFTFKSKDNSTLNVQTIYDDKGNLVGIEIIK